MKAEKLTEAMNELDDRYVEQAIRYRAKRPTAMWIKWASVAACLCLVVAAVIAVMPQINREPGTADTPDTMPFTFNAQEIVVNSSGDHASNSKPTFGHQLAFECKSFYTEKIISLDVFFASPTGSAEKNAIPVFQVYQYQEDKNYNYPIENGDLMINEAGSFYEKRFAPEDLSYLEMPFWEDILDVFDAHSEKVTLDFSKVPVGETVSIVIASATFHQDVYNENSHDYSPDHPFRGLRFNRRSLSFYVGENGISVSNFNPEDAIANYEKAITPILNGTPVGSGMCY